MNAPAHPLISIGALKRATGIPVETIRTWERRYGYPVPIRRPSGHRRYPQETIERLRLIQSALGLGHRAAEVVPAEPEALEQLIGLSRTRQDSGKPLSREIQAWLDAVEGLDGDALSGALQRAWTRSDARSFVCDLVLPFVRAVGERWADGRLTVAHEHFASERLRDFLAGQWRPLVQTARGPRVVCACLPGELHGLSLHMAAVLLGLSDVRVTLLGPDTPIADIVRTAVLTSAEGVVVSVSRASDPAAERAKLEELRGRLDASVCLAVGWPHRPAGLLGLPDTHALEDFDELWSFLPRLENRALPE